MATHQFSIFPSNSPDQYRVMRGRVGETEPRNMGLAFLGSRSACELFMRTADADAMTARIAAESEAFWKGVEERGARLRSRMGSWA